MSRLTHCPPPPHNGKKTKKRQFFSITSRHTAVEAENWWYVDEELHFCCHSSCSFPSPPAAAAELALLLPPPHCAEISTPVRSLRLNSGPFQLLRATRVHSRKLLPARAAAADIVLHFAQGERKEKENCKQRRTNSPTPAFYAMLPKLTSSLSLPLPSLPLLSDHNSLSGGGGDRVRLAR